jgi:long-subunit acyl-CoA synthetase (AMP-forming)
MGEIMLAGPQLMAGYWQQPELTAQVLEEGWLRSGDLGRIRADGYCRSWAAAGNHPQWR